MKPELEVIVEESESEPEPEEEKEEEEIVNVIQMESPKNLDETQEPSRILLSST